MLDKLPLNVASTVRVALLIMYKNIKDTGMTDLYIKWKNTLHVWFNLLCEMYEYLMEKGIDLYQWGASVGISEGKEWLFYNTYDKIGFDLEIMNEIVRKK